MKKDRAKAWAIKTDPKLFIPVWASRHDEASKKVEVAFSQIDDVYDKVRAILDHYGVHGSQRLLYRSYAEELWRLSKRFTGKTFELEAEAVGYKYGLLGGEYYVMRSISALFGLDLFRNLIPKFIKAFDSAYTLRCPDVAQNPVTMQFSHDVFGRLTKIVITDNVTGKTKVMLFTYDEKGRLLKITQFWQ